MFWGVVRDHGGCTGWESGLGCGNLRRWWFGLLLDGRGGGAGEGWGWRVVEEVVVLCAGSG